MAEKAVVLVSGGLDSATVLALAREEGYDITALTILYGQRHQVEVDRAQQIVRTLGPFPHHILQIPLDQIGGSALTAEIEVPKGRDEVQRGNEIPVTYVPARNTVFLSLALAVAEVAQANHIFIGVNAVDYSGYPDCRPEFISAFENLARVATRAGVGGQELQIHAPLMHLSKAEIITLGEKLGVNYAHTISCYDPDADGRPCRECDSCRIRAEAFAELGRSDPSWA